MRVRKNKKTIINEFIRAYKVNNTLFSQAVKDFKAGKAAKKAIVSAMGSILTMDKEIFHSNDLDREAKNKIYEMVLKKRK